VAPSDPTERRIQTQQITNLTNMAIPGVSSLCQLPVFLTALWAILLTPISLSTPMSSTVPLQRLSAECRQNERVTPRQGRVSFICFLALPLALIDGKSTKRNCLRRIGLGPCVANPSGAACLLGQFAGTQFVVGGGNSSSSKHYNSLGW
jgi:hypothetical protein